jgi:hypothetical protein
LENISLSAVFPNLRTAMRNFTGDDGVVTASVWQVKLRGWLRVPAILRLVKGDMRVVEFWTEFSDGKFIATLQGTRARAPNMPIVVIGLPVEWESVETVASAVGGLAVRTPTLRDALALVGTADMVFTPDTSISHAASAFRKPSVVLLKREHKPYAPWNTPGQVVSWGEEQIHQLPHERVSDALEKLLADFGG